MDTAGRVERFRRKYAKNEPPKSGGEELISRADFRRFNADQSKV